MWKIVVIVFVLLPLWVTDVQACSCSVSFKDEKRQVRKAKQEAAAAFRGRIVDILETKGADGKLNGGIEAIMEISEVWKGIVGERVSVFTNGDDASCGYPFVEGKDYLVYAYVSTEAKDRLITYLCTRTRLAEGKPYLIDRKHLGKPKS